MSIEFKKVSKKFGERSVLQDISFRIESGEILFLLGRSGVGKSVTLKTIVGLLKPDQGEVWVDGRPVHSYNEEELSEVRKICGMVFQHPALFDSLNVWKNVAFGLPEQWDEEKKKERVKRCLELVHLSADLMEKRITDLSYGMQKRVSLARTIAPTPKVLLFDEPTTGLDPVTTRAINDLILELSRKLSVTSVVVSHDMSCAFQIADRIIVLDQGKILSMGSPKELKSSSVKLVQDFLVEVI